MTFGDQLKGEMRLDLAEMSSLSLVKPYEIINSQSNSPAYARVVYLIALL